MTGIAIELLLSWILLKYILKTELSVLGLKPERKHLITIVWALVWPILLITGIAFAIAYVTHNPYQINRGYSSGDFFRATAYVVRAVIFEELIFRGALFYMLIHWLGNQRAMLLSAVCFGVYHWFSWNLFGQPTQMAIAFLTTGITGYLLAWSFVRTRTLFVPIGLHLGLNFANMILLSRDQTIGLQLLARTFTTDPHVPAAIISVPLVILHFIGFYVVGFFWVRSLAQK